MTCKNGSITYSYYCSSRKKILYTCIVYNILYLTCSSTKRQK
nr:MAG TPA: hypothetical protein [Caudoviricetes sp.]